MSSTPTYFENRLDSTGLDRLLSGRISFHLENVRDVDAAAASFEQALRDRDLKVRVQETRSSKAEDVAATILLPGISVFLVARMLYRDALVRLRNLHPDVVVLKRNGALEIRHKRRP
ncbi:hypothetical protein ACL598_03275 [Bordetella bronchialis]|uniref:Uncharacterized protein n=1 Tax=Bordetella bronchialis TaxID=463025 RepID=A0A193FTX5_9BORD|nr:hypothetical protein [Bordetella bronchialis]ANN70636.1 hypothetical protein BAU08_04195 [Bordetella bronchialis]